MEKLNGDHKLGKHAVAEASCGSLGHGQHLNTPPVQGGKGATMTTPSVEGGVCTWADITDAKDQEICDEKAAEDYCKFYYFDAR